MNIVSEDLESFALALHMASEDVGGLVFSANGAISSSMPGTRCSCDFEAARDTLEVLQATAVNALDPIAESTRLAASDDALNEEAAQAALHSLSGVLHAVE